MKKLLIKRFKAVQAMASMKAVSVGVGKNTRVLCGPGRRLNVMLSYARICCESNRGFTRLCYLLDLL